MSPALGGVQGRGGVPGESRLEELLSFRQGEVQVAHPVHRHMQLIGTDVEDMAAVCAIRCDSVEVITRDRHGLGVRR